MENVFIQLFVCLHGLEKFSWSRNYFVWLIVNGSCNTSPFKRFYLYWFSNILQYSVNRTSASPKISALMYDQMVPQSLYEYVGH